MKSTQLVTLISRDEKINASAVWGSREAWGPPGPLDKTALGTFLEPYSSSRIQPIYVALFRLCHLTITFIQTTLNSSSISIHLLFILASLTYRTLYNIFFSFHSPWLTCSTIIAIHHSLSSAQGSKHTCSTNPSHHRSSLTGRPDFLHRFCSTSFVLFSGIILLVYAYVLCRIKLTASQLFDHTLI